MKRSERIYMAFKAGEISRAEAVAQLSVICGCCDHNYWVCEKCQRCPGCCRCRFGKMRAPEQFPRWK